MDRIESRKYESIDALIMAAEVLERAEAMAKKQFALQDNLEISNCCFPNSNDSNLENDDYKHHQMYNEDNKEDQLTDGLISTICYIKDLETTERWTELFESKHKSDNRILFRELSDLKKKLNKITKEKRMNAIIKDEEDEDTSTASEDEDYNKYNPMTATDNVDDVTDDASECEGSAQRSPRTALNNAGLTTKTTKIPRISSEDNLPDTNISEFRIINRKRKSAHLSPRRAAIAKVRPSLLTDTATAHKTRHHPNNIPRPSIPLLSLHQRKPIDYKSLSKVRQPVDT